MKRLFNVIVLVLAMNFLAVIGTAAWLFKSGHLDRQKLVEMKKLLFPPPAVGTDHPATTQPDATTQPAARLEELLSKASGRTAVEQVEFIQQTFDAQVAQLDRKQRELADLQRQVDLARQQMTRDRAKVVQAQNDLAAQQAHAAKLASDKGFQDSLGLYTSMAPRKVKEIFMTLNDDVIQQYFQAMEPRAASKIIKEFKTPDEVQRIQRVLEKMRSPEVVPAAAANTPLSADASPSAR